jgi:four helix bundle protein
VPGRCGVREKVRRVEDLEVFRRAYQLSLAIHKASLALPRIEQFALADQLRRASKSICANLVEGFAKQSHSAAEYRRYLTVAIGSSDETQLWLRYCVDLGYIESDEGRRWIADYVEISKMLQGLYASWSSVS